MAQFNTVFRYMVVYMGVPTQSCPPSCDPMDYSMPGSMGFIHQARVLEWVAISFSRGSSDPGIQPMSPVAPAMAGRFFTTEPPVIGRYFSFSCMGENFTNR